MGTGKFGKAMTQNQSCSLEETCNHKINNRNLMLNQHQIQEQITYLRSKNNETMRGYVLDELGVERVIEKITMKEEQQRELPCFRGRSNQELQWRGNRKR